VRETVIAYWRRRLGARAAAGMTTLLIALGLVAINSDRGWEFGALAMFTILLIVGLCARIATHMHASLRNLRQLDPPQVRLQVSDDEFTMESNMGRSSLRWSGISEVWQFERFWLVFLFRQQFVTWPVDDVPGDARAFILERVRAAGGRVR
jgi:hypothetical protein